MEDVDMLAFYVAILDTEEQKDKFTEIYTTYYARDLPRADREDRFHPHGQRQTARLLPAHGHTESHHRLHAQVGSPKCVIL